MILKSAINVIGCVDSECYSSQYLTILVNTSLSSMTRFVAG